MLRLITVFLLLPLLLMGCSKKNPLLALPNDKLIAFMKQQGPLKMAQFCSKYYLESDRAGITPAGTKCTKYTRKLVKAAQQQQLLGDNKVTVQLFRDKAFWRHWNKIYSE